MAEKVEGILCQKIAYIDLSRGTVDMEVVPLEWHRRFLGARGINMHLISRLTKADTDPLGPDNPLIIGLGLITGLPGFGSGRYNITALSPLTGPSKNRPNIGDANIGGHFGHEMRHTGFDYLVITGQSPKPVYLLITNDHIEIKDASHLWGLDTWETQKVIQREHRDERMRSLCIGPAGENVARMACIITGPKDAAGGSGMGAVMGSKKLKAIAARGSKDLAVAHPDELLRYFQEQQDILMERKWIKALGRLGTPLMLAIAVAGGYGAGDEKTLMGKAKEEAKGVFAENLLPYSLGHSACAGCAVHCRHRYLVAEGPYAGARGEGPEYGALHALGLALRITDPKEVLYLNGLVNKLGLPTQTGIHVAQAIKLYEEGIIDDTMVDRPLKFGDIALYESLLNDIAYRRGIGDILADDKFGYDRLPPEAQKYRLSSIKGAHNVVDWGLTVREFVFGQITSSLPGHVHRSRTGLGVLGLPAEVMQKIYDGHPVSPDKHSFDGKAYMTWWHEILYAVCDAVGCCQFQTVMNSPNAPKYEEYSKLIYLATGLDMPVPYLREVGERIYTQERMLLWRFGFGEREHDRVPQGWIHSREQEEERKKFDGLLDEYYELHGWDATGHPRPETLKRLGLLEMLDG